MKRLIALALLFSFSFSAFADCTQAIESEIKTKLEKAEKTKKIGRITTGSVFGSMTAFWGTMGVILVGPAGVLIGVQFGAVAAAPFAATFYTIKKVKQARIKSLVGTLSVVQAANDIDGANETSFTELLEEINKKKPELTMDQLKAEIVHLNDSQALCDGSIKKNILGLKALKKYLLKTM